MDSNTTADASPSPEAFEQLMAQGKRAFALKQWEQATEFYSDACEMVVELYGEDDVVTADCFFVYGKALLEEAIAENDVLGRNQAEDAPDAADATATANGSSRGGPLLSFSGDADDMDDKAVDLFAEAAKAVAEAEAAVAGEGDDDDDQDEDEDDEPEDGFNRAWEVLEMARTKFEKLKENGGDESVQLQLAEAYNTLGDLSMETEKFDQAIPDYETGLGLKLQILPISSRQIAESHYKLSIMLDMTPGRLSDAIVHAEKALESIEARYAELEQALPTSSATVQPEAAADLKGKGKAKAPSEMTQLTTSQIEAEMKEVAELKGELMLKIEELKTSPNDNTTQSAPAQAAEALDKELNVGMAVQNQQPVVNDLTGMIKKKKKAPEATPAPKRKAEDDGDGSGSEKKPKIDES